MKVVLVAGVDAWVRSVSTIHKWVKAGRTLGHEIAVYGDANPELPQLSFTTNLRDVDVGLFVVQVPTDFPEMPHLARVLDGIPRQKRVVADLWGRFNDTIRVEHDFNHLEKLDGHMGWEWEDAIRLVGGTIVQPALRPLRPHVGSFLFHGFDPDSVVKPHKTAREAAAAWNAKPLGVMYVGSNWQRWDQVRSFLEGYASVRNNVGRVCLVGWDWDARPDWAVQKGIMGVNTDPAFLAELGVEFRDGVRFDEVVAALGQARFVPVFHRPLFRHLGFVTNRTFETFYADTLPVLMLPRDFVSAIYGPAALALVPGEDVGAHLADALKRPELYWDAVLQTRDHLARHHSFAQRLRELAALVDAGSRSGEAR
jgi:hypothetical protein